MIAGSTYIRGIQGQGLLCAPMIETILIALENSLDFFGVLRHFQPIRQLGCQYRAWKRNKLVKLPLVPSWFEIFLRKFRPFSFHLSGFFGCKGSESQLRDC